MQKFFYYWLAIFSVILVAPSFAVGAAAVYSVGDGLVAGAPSLIFVMTFLTTLLAIGWFTIVPAVIILIAGLFICGFRRS